MKKKSILIVGILCLTPFISKTATVIAQKGNIFYNQEKFSDNNLNLSDKHVVLGADFNDFLFGKRMDLQWKLFKDIVHEKGFFYAALAFSQAMNVKSMKKKQQLPPTAIFKQLAEKNPNLPGLEEVLTKAMLEVVTPNLEVALNLKNAETDFFKVVGFSNMGTTMAKLQANRLKNDADVMEFNATHGSTSLTSHVPIGNNIDITVGESIVLYRWIADLIENPHTVIATEKGDYYKPNPQAYKKFLHRNNPLRTHITILADDKMANIIAALENGIDIGILIKDKDHPAKEFITALSNLGLAGK